MQDNGLLRYYRQKHARENGQLKLVSNPFKLNIEFYDGYGTVRAMYNNNQKYFYKFVDKREVDAEVLLSQIYAKAGFLTAIYTPLNPMGVISQKVDDETCKIAKDFYILKANEEFDKLSDVDKAIVKDGRHPVVFREFANFSHIFTKDCAREFLKMRLFDVSTNNTDRNLANYFVKLNEDNMGEELRLIDYGASGNPYKPLKYFSSLSGDVINFKEDIIKDFKTIEAIQQFATPNELAEEIGSIDVVETANDIKQTINYEIEKGYVDKIAESMEQTAEALIK